MSGGAIGMNNSLPTPPENDNEEEALSKLLSKKRVTVIRTAVPTFLFALSLIILCGVLLKNEKSNSGVADIEPVQTSTPTPIPTSTVLTPTIVATSTPELIPVEYQIIVTGNDATVPLQFWFTNENESIEIDSQDISNGHPFTHTVQMRPNAYIELSGVITNTSDGNISCRILVGGVLVEQRTGQSSQSGVYCSGVVLRTKLTGGFKDFLRQIKE